MPVIVITGASSGIGRACAERFLQAGWQVGLIARRADLLDQVAGGHPAALALPCDVTDAGAVDAAFAAAESRFGRIDALFNNAGFMPPARLIDEVEPDDWRQIVDVNLTGMFLCARAAFRTMRRQSPQGGRIINNGSIAAHAPRPGSVGYTTNKHAITGLTKTLELDGRPFGITASQIDIGNARTQMTAGITAGATQADGSRRPEPGMDLASVASTVLHMASLPPDATIPFLALMAPGMPWLGRG
jgi:NAD(P)-dependent dehydrogenase (short-subunit alcohol dehydrogenase family)